MELIGYLLGSALFAIALYLDQKRQLKKEEKKWKILHEFYELNRKQEKEIQKALRNRASEIGQDDERRTEKSY